MSGGGEEGGECGGTGLTKTEQAAAGDCRERLCSKVAKAHIASDSDTTGSGLVRSAPRECAMEDAIKASGISGVSPLGKSASSRPVSSSCVRGQWSTGNAARGTCQPV